MLSDLQEMRNSAIKQDQAMLLLKVYAEELIKKFYFQNWVKYVTEITMLFNGNLPSPSKEQWCMITEIGILLSFLLKKSEWEVVYVCESL